ncbi:hypothetical protein BCV69DRAFT_10789 [Microstroma glucosiphilum]|uniref:DUF788-domain-containing protein n=1 Tax=Pseudomicrostroma glucosiphilum TaxID=1684307 RepID=A0A316UEY0_9BASI|nr:hypothetical protein BCV69DRAFT_10789 [Pseudomicrostroma glucosiphilum]PWN23806.1 hypothetical protein BCV69DRAFT_10789 [Pseudomicrostroma glucosiphilum]
MAKGASKRISSQNASSLTLLFRGFLITNLLQILSLTLLTPGYRRRSSSYKWDIIKYVLTEAIAAGLGLVMRDMAKKGDDLSAEGLTALMWDVVFVTWAVHVGTALIWRRFWWLYAVIPLYSTYLAYSKLIVPFLFRGADPIASLFSAVTGRAAPRNAGPAQGTGEEKTETLSKRQQKLAARADRGDARVQRREVKRG